MKRGLQILFLLGVLAFMAGCRGGGGDVTLRIVATSDVHGRIFDTDCLDGEVRPGSLAKFSSFLRQQRKEYRNVIYLDAGDILQGSVEMYQDVTAQFERTSLAAQALNLLGCDAMVMGNHDFAVGGNSYDRFFRGLEFPLLGANAFFEQYGDYMTPFRILEIQGLKVAVLGFTTPVINYSIPKDRLELDLAPIKEAAEHWMPVIKDEIKADVVIGLMHSGLEDGRMDDEGLYENAVSQVVGSVHGFDVVIYGHDHMARCFRMADCNGDSVLLLNPGAFAVNAAVATVNVSFDQSGRPQVLTSGSLEDITEEVPDSRFMKKLSGWYDDVRNYSDSIIGAVKVTMDGSGVLWRRSSIMDYVHQIQMGFNGAQISLTLPAFTKPSVPCGRLQIRDLFAIYQFDNNMVSVMLKGSEVKDILEYSAGLYYNTVADATGPMLRYVTDENGTRTPQTPCGRLVTAAGIEYVIDVTKPEGSRVEIISFTDGTEFKPDAYYRTTVNTFLYSSPESAVFKATGLTHKDLARRFITSSQADIRYFMLTNLALAHETDRAVTVRPVSNWKLVPEDVVSECLSKDTIQFSILKNRMH